MPELTDSAGAEPEGADNPRRIRRWLVVGLLVIVAGALAVLGVSLIQHGAKHTAAPPAPLPSQTFSVDPAAIAALPAIITRLNPTPGSTTPCPASATASHVIVSALCIDAPIVPEVIKGNELIIPSDVHQVGLWMQGAGLTSKDGTTLLAGHVNFIGQGDGAFADLYKAEPGMSITVVDAAGKATAWRAISMSVVSKSKLPPAVFAGTGGARRLVLVTCGGPVDFVPGYGYSYRDNVILTAVLAQ